MTRIPERIPAPLSERIASASAAIFNRQGREVDCAIGGIPFRLATYPEVPQTLETMQVRKDQFDTERDPGEQSLSGWWRRSQSSFHEGAGFLYAESSDDNSAHNGFWDSSGVDVFTQGQITLLRTMSPVATSLTSASRIKTFAANSTRTNLCTNPSFETNTTGWTPNDGGTPANLPTITRDTTKFVVGVASGRLDWASDDATGTPPGLAVPVTGLTANQPFTASMKVWVPTGSADVLMVSNGNLGTTSSGKNAWVSISITSTADGSGNANLFLWPATPVAAGQQVYIDTTLAETGVVVGSYFDGSSPNGAWTGTANNSTSTETIVATGISVSLVNNGQLYTTPLATFGPTSLHAPASKTIVDGVISGGSFYDVASDGTLYQGLVSSPGTATSWPCGTTPYRLGWGKHRLWMIGGRKLWQPDLALAGGTTQNPVFTHPNQGWTYTCMAEGPTAMYFGGHDGFTSSIQAITLDSGGGLPTLSGASNTVILPDGELVQEIAVLAGQYIGIGTTRGFRVGVIQSNGTITYGPLLIEPTNVTACTSITTQDRFFLVAFGATGGNAKAYRVDTATLLADGVMAYASDIELKTDGVTPVLGSITSMVAAKSQLLATASNGSIWLQSFNERVRQGWIQTGRIRYRTTEPKNFKFLNLEIAPLPGGSITADIVKEGDSVLPVGVVNVVGEVAPNSFAISTEVMKYVSLKLTLNRESVSGVLSPTVHAFLLRALPAVKPQRMYTLPLMCFDHEQARSGQRYGGDGYAKDRLQALQIIEDSADSVVFQDFSAQGAEGRIVTIESLRFVQTVPSLATGDNNSGGLLIAQLRTVEG